MQHVFHTTPNPCSAHIPTHNTGGLSLHPTSNPHHPSHPFATHTVGSSCTIPAKESLATTEPGVWPKPALPTAFAAVLAIAPTFTAITAVVAPSLPPSLPPSLHTPWPSQCCGSTLQHTTHTQGTQLLSKRAIARACCACCSPKQ